MMFVASASTLGAATASTTPMAPSTDTNTNHTADGLSRPIIRRKLGPKRSAFPGATLSQPPPFWRACSASSASYFSSSVSSRSTAGAAPAFDRAAAMRSRRLCGLS